MGINGINQLLKRHASDAFFSMSITKFSGKRIAIDGNNWMYTSMAIARKKVIRRTDVSLTEPNPIEIRREWFLSAITFILGWLSYNVTPVFVFDGRHPPEKDETKAKRRDQRTALRDEIDVLYAQIRGDILERPANVIDELRKKLSNYNFISAEDFELFKIVIRGIGIPCLQAEGDGERLCSTLCAEQKVAAVFSVDTDNFVYGCPVIITKFSDIASYDEYGQKIPHVECVRLDRILSGLKISHSKFVDLCIMSGCDYNTNMPGHAAIKSYSLIQKYGSIDNLPRNFNIECLKHIRCRELFKFQSSDTLIIREDDIDTMPEGYDELIPLNVEPHQPLNINKRAITSARDYLEMAGISGQIDRIIASYQHITPANDGLIEDLNLTIITPYVPPLPRLSLNIASQSHTPLLTVPLPYVPQPTILSQEHSKNQPSTIKFLTLNILSKHTNIPLP